VIRLRKCLKSRRITSVSQIGTDRVIDIAFSDGLFHLFLEFFAGGNIILTDGDQKILALFRQVSAGGDQEEVKVGLNYTVTNKQNYDGVPALTQERVKQTLQHAVDAVQTDNVQNKLKKKRVDAIRKALSQGFPEYPPLLLDHAIAVAEFDTSIPLAQILEDPQLLAKAFNILNEAERITKEVASGDKHAGYIIAKEDNRPSTSSEPGDSNQRNLLYEDFHPFKPRQFETKSEYRILELDGFNKTVDEYYSSIESQKLESRLTEHEEAARRKLESARREHQKRVGALKQAQELHIRKAEAIEANVYRVQEAMDAVNGLIAQGMDWVEMARLIEMEQGRNNPVAQTIQLPLKLYENTITLALNEASYEAEEEDEAYGSGSEEEDSDASDPEDEVAQRRSERLTIDIDLGLSPWANATQYHNQKKVAAVKEQRTVQSSEKALKSQEKKVSGDLKRNLKQERQVLRPSRQPFWFEKYVFFISSEGYLVLGGHDVHQVEALYRRYLKKGDIFVHADIEGATPIIVKNREDTPDAPIPPGTLSQAGSLSVATSKAWESKALMPAWWVHAHQVSKTNARGELVAIGDFVIQGEKNFLAPAQPILGFAVMYQISRESVPNHQKHRLREPVEAEAAVSTSDVIPRAETEQADQHENTMASSENVREDLQQTADDDADETQERDAENQEPDSDSESDKDDEEESNVKSNPLQTEAQGEQEDDETSDEYEQNEIPTIEENSSTVGSVESTSQSQGRRYLSVHDRRLLKKGKSPDSTEDTTSSIPSGESRASTPGLSQASSKQTLVANTRGKRGKAKKAAQKYADQDEEERELALRLLGSNAKAGKAAETAAAKAKRDAELEAQKLRRRAQHERAAESERRRQAQLHSNGKAKGGADGEDDTYDEETAKAEAEDLSWLPALVGTPLPEDEVLAAIPVAAPWAALGRYKYRAKLQPGSVKKGKAVKEVLGHWILEASGSTAAGGKIGKKAIADDIADGLDRSTAERMRAREAELLKGWRDVEVVNTIPVGKVRIVSGGGGGKGASGGGKGDSKGGKGKGGGGGQKGGKGGKKK
jgi:predicted ribosome quality control (RQC) complex YloA/Tae2 family protein